MKCNTKHGALSDANEASRKAQPKENVKSKAGYGPPYDVTPGSKQPAGSRDNVFALGNKKDY